MASSAYIKFSKYCSLINCFDNTVYDKIVILICCSHICPGEETDVLEVSLMGKSVESSNINSLKWPYLIVGIGHITFSLGYLALKCLPYKMPGKYEYCSILISHIIKNSDTK